MHIEDFLRTFVFLAGRQTGMTVRAQLLGCICCLVLAGAGILDGK